jgi:hypothetical protein
MGEGNDTCGVELAKSAWTQIAACLENRKARVYEEIKNYPTPITACDQQFNHLLDQLAKVCGELARMRRAAGESSNHGDAMGILRAFLESADFVDDELKQEARSRLKVS